MQYVRTRQSGVSLVEVLIALSIIATMLVAVGFSVTAYVTARSELLDDTKGLYLAEEGYEILRMVRDDDWDTIDTLALDTPHYFDVATDTIAVSGTQNAIDGSYHRSFILRAVYRDSDDDITSSTTAGATVDTELRYATIYVSGPTGTTSVHAILSNLHAI